MTPDGRLPSLTSSLRSETINNKVRKNQLPVKSKRRRTTSFFSNWQQYTEEEKNSFCRLNNRSFSEFKRARDSAAKLALHKKKKNQCPFCEKSYQQLVTFRRHLVAHFHCTQSSNPCNQHSKEQKQRESEAEQNHNEKPKMQNIATTKRTRYISLRNSEFCCLFCHTCFPNTAIDDIEHHLAKHSRLENITKELEAVIRTKTILTTSTSAANSPSPTSG
ncbi:Oidioi.mRNA.OKI2018_I69.XSR.g15168.t1.cds [Oikopleura dioica]|uniref:Oidioi.mRNA.OKI2018_I69.XSR.g15168.t1.cds n=1 Tax=Oikopleura dioica TaxID=34765 RepID=A0ABN7SCG6_OIKDI|nr:Oidioi.mRNA.OKI2018_I69.XSR.g15168.t1.cds [Oikopleura dioica]